MNAPSRSVVLTIALVIGLIVSAGLAQADDTAWKAAHDTDPHLALTQQQLDATAAKRAAEAPSAAPLIGALAAPWSECGSCAAAGAIRARRRSSPIRRRRQRATGAARRRFTKRWTRSECPFRSQPQQPRS